MTFYVSSTNYRKIYIGQTLKRVMSRMSKEDKYTKHLDEYVEFIKEPINQIIKNRAALDISYVPDELLFRDNEFGKIRKKTKSLFMNSQIPHLIIWGIPGTGKTAVMKYILRLISDASKKTKLKVGQGYVNCKGATEYSIITTIMESVGIHLSGQMQNTNILYHRLTQKLEKEQRMYFFVFDDFDKTKKGEEKEVLFNLTRLPYFNFCLIVNSTNFVKELEKYTLSSFNPRSFLFSKYTKEQLRGIAEQRIKLALTRNIFTEDALEAIVNLASLSGDARYEISLLGACVDIIEEEKKEVIDVGVVAKGRKLIEMDAAKEIVRKMAHNYVIELYAVLLEQDNGKIPTTTEAYKKYTDLEEKITVSIISKRQFIRDLDDLATTGLIDRVEGYAHRWGISKFYDRDELLLFIENELMQDTKTKVIPTQDSESN